MSRRTDAVVIAMAWLVPALGALHAPVAIRAVPGVLLVLLWPGLGLVRLVQPRRRAVRPELQLIAALAATIAIDAATGLVLDVTTGLTARAWMVALAVVTTVLAIAAVRRALAAGTSTHADRGEPTAISSRLFSLRVTRSRAWAALGVAVAIALGFSAVEFSRSDAAQIERNAGVTDLWMVPVKGDPLAVRLGIDHEGDSTGTYELVLTAGGNTVRRWENISVAPSQPWRTTVSLPSLNKGVRADLLVGGAQFRRVQFNPPRGPS
jgi:hypothetical protein